MGKKRAILPNYPFRLDRRTARLQPLKRGDERDDILLAYNALDLGDELKAMRYFKRAHQTYRAGQRNEMSGITEDRRGGSIGARRTKATVANMLAYAENLPKGGGGRGNKSRWRLTAEHFHPTATPDRLASIARRLKRKADE
jgi:hypothetical protein